MKGLTLPELFNKFPDEKAARKWFEKEIWPEGRHCPRCGYVKTKCVPKENPMPYWCPACREYFSVRTNTIMQNSHLSLHKWVLAVYLMSVETKGISTRKLAGYIGVTQKTAWLLSQKIREGWRKNAPTMNGPVEMDGTYVGGKERNKHFNKRTGRMGVAGKEVVVGMVDRETGTIHAEHAQNSQRPTLIRLISERTSVGASIYTDNYASYSRVPRRHRFVNHSRGEYRKGDVHTNNIESFWAILKRGYQGVYYHWSKKHLFRYVNEFKGRQNMRFLDPLSRMKTLVKGFEGKRLTYRELIRKPPRTGLYPL